MTYPNAYCVKCGSHTETLQKHTVMLQNSARAVTGVCSNCASPVYKIVPKARVFHATRHLSVRRYPNTFCMRCQRQTETLNQKMVILENTSRALTGECKDCGAEVYRLLSPSHRAAWEALKKGSWTTASRIPAVRSPHAESMYRSQWPYVAVAGTVIVVICGFFVYAVV